MAQQVSIDTAQNVQLTYELAGVGPRLLAYLIDGFIKGAYLVLVFLLYSVLEANVSLFGLEEAAVVFFIFLFFPVMFYSFLFETFYHGQTPGKKVVKIKVVRLDGSSASVGNYFMRWIFRLVDFQLFSGLVAIISIASSKNGQRIGDMAAGTTVISLARNIRLEDIHPPEIYEQEYIPTYPEVMKLSDKDVEIIKQILQKADTKNNMEILNQTVEKVKEITGISTIRQLPADFLRTMINDYNYYASSEM